MYAAAAFARNVDDEDVGEEIGEGGGEAHGHLAAVKVVATTRFLLNFVDCCCCYGRCLVL